MRRRQVGVGIATLMVAGLALTTEGQGAPKVAPLKGSTTTSTSVVPTGQTLVPASIDADCSTDVSIPLNEFLRSVPDGATIGFPFFACYRVENTIVISDRHNLTFVGNGVIFRSVTSGAGLTAWDGKQVTWPRQRAHLAIVNSTNISVIGVKVEGPNSSATYSSSLEGQAGFVVGGSTGVTIQGCSATNVHGDFAEVSNNSSNVVVRGCTFSGSGRQGLTVHQGTDVLFEGNQVTRVPRSAVDIEPELDWVVQRVTFRGNVFTAPIGHVIFANGGTGALVEDVTWEGNRVVGRDFQIKSGGGTSPTTGVVAVHRRYVFTGNSADTPGEGPVWSFSNLDGLVVENNTVPVACFSIVKGSVSSSGVWLALDGVTNVSIGQNSVGCGVVSVEGSAF